MCILQNEKLDFQEPGVIHEERAGGQLTKYASGGKSDVAKVTPLLLLFPERTHGCYKRSVNLRV
jgi:hypothetical protein